MKRLAIASVIVIVASGVTFLGLDILDIEAAFEPGLLVAALNALFVSVVAVAVACMAARSFAITSSARVLWLGSSALAFGVGSLLRGWLVTEELGPRIIINDSSALISSLLHFVGATFGGASLHLTGPATRQRRTTAVFFYYFGTLLSIALLVSLAIRGVIPSFSAAEAGSTPIRDIVRGLAAALLLASSSVYLRMYSRSRTFFPFWYSLGLMLLAFGVIFSALGPVYSPIAWVGRVSQWAGSIYLLCAVLTSVGLANDRPMEIEATRRSRTDVDTERQERPASMASSQTVVLKVSRLVYRPPAQNEQPPAHESRKPTPGRMRVSFPCPRRWRKGGSLR